MRHFSYIARDPLAVSQIVLAALNGGKVSAIHIQDERGALGKVGGIFITVAAPDRAALASCCMRSTAWKEI